MSLQQHTDVSSNTSYFSTVDSQRFCTDTVVMSDITSPPNEAAPNCTSLRNKYADGTNNGYWNMSLTVNTSTSHWPWSALMSVENCTLWFETGYLTTNFM